MKSFKIFTVCIFFAIFAAITIAEARVSVDIEKSEILKKVPTENRNNVVGYGFSYLDELLENSYNPQNQKILKMHILSIIDGIFITGVPRIFEISVNRVQAQNLIRDQLQDSAVMIGYVLDGHAKVEVVGERTSVRVSGQVEDYPKTLGVGMEVIGIYMQMVDNFGFGNNNMPKTLQRITDLNDENAQLASEAFLRLLYSTAK